MGFILQSGPLAAVVTFVLTLQVLGCFVGVQCTTNDTGQYDDCTTNFATLESALIRTPNNTYKLWTEFYPPREAMALFVFVKYQIINNSTSSIEYIWTSAAFNLIHPPRVFGITSLFFGFIQRSRIGNVTLQLPENCEGLLTSPNYERSDEAAKSDFLEVLTQRLRLYAKFRSNGSDVVIPDKFEGKAILLTPNAILEIYHNINKTVTLITLLFGIPVLLCPFMIIYLKGARRQIRFYLRNSDHHASLAALISVSLIFSTFVFGMDVAAIYFAYAENELKMYANVDSHNLTFAFIPVILVIDFLALAMALVILVTLACNFFHYCPCCKKSNATSYINPPETARLPENVPETAQHENARNITQPENVPETALPPAANNAPETAQHENAPDIAQPKNAPETAQPPENAPETAQTPENAPETVQQPENAPETAQPPAAENAPETAQPPENAPETAQTPENAPETAQQPGNAPETAQPPAAENAPETAQPPENAHETAQPPENEAETAQPPENAPGTAQPSAMKLGGNFLQDACRSCKNCWKCEPEVATEKCFCVFFAAIFCLGKLKSSDDRQNEQQVWLLTIVFAAPFVAFGTHFTYIVIAWIQYPDHAGAISIMYILTFLYFFITFRFLYLCLSDNKAAYCCAKDGDIESPAVEAAEYEELERNKFKAWKVCVIALIGIFLCGVEIWLIAGFVTLPIAEVIEDAPTYIYAWFRTIFVIVTGLITYKLLTFQRSDNTFLVTVLKACKYLYGQGQDDESNIPSVYTDVEKAAIALSVIINQHGQHEHTNGDSKAQKLWTKTFTTPLEQPRPPLHD